MLKLTLNNEHDLRESALIEKKRRNEEDRKARIFNPRHRLIGVDYEALDSQIKEKNKQRQEEQERERKYVSEQLRISEIASSKEKELSEERKRIENEINQYRMIYQKKEDTRDFDLNDPKFISKTVPCRINDNDTRLGISSAQKFIGEDLMGKERKKAQIEQQRAWLQQQIKEKKQAESERQQADKVIQAALEARDQRTLDLESFERNARKKIQEENARFNLKLANDQECNKWRKKKQEEEDNLAEIYNNLTSDMLTENPDCAQSAFGIGKKVPNLYRGMTQAELAAFRKAHAEQIKENAQTRQEDDITKARWETMTTNMARQTLLQEREMERKTRLLKEQIKEENNQLAIQQKKRNEYMNNVVFRNEPTAEYFAQFNTTSR